MVIQHNLSSIRAKNRLKANITGVKKASEKLSSGYRINRAGDDAAGLAVSEKMRGQIRGLDQAVRNSQDGINLIQTFEGALGETVAIIHRAKGLAEQMANGTYDDSVDRSAVELEYLHLCDEVNQIAETDFNGIVMLGGKPESAVKAAELESRINSAAESFPAAVSELSAQSAAPNIETRAFAASAAAFSAPKAGSVACGDFTVYGNSSDFSFDTASGVLTILGGDVTVEGTGAATTNTIVVAKDKSANVTLKNVNIDVSRMIGACAFKIEDDSNGNVNITLEGDNTLKSFSGAGLQKNGDISSGTLSIDGDGSLEVIGGTGIGGSAGNIGANITINGGSIFAVGSSGAAIGGGNGSDGINIIINGGTVWANGDYGAAIGGGDGGSGINITINGGTVTPFSTYGAGIGGGEDGLGFNITISGGVVKSVSHCGSGIGGGANGEGIGITINDGTVLAVSSDGGSGIGGGKKGRGTNITISGGVVYAGSDYGGAGIGGGSYADGTNITISGGTVTTTAVDHNSPPDDRHGGAGIGGGRDGNGTNITIMHKETVVIAKGGTNAEDIGKGANCEKVSSVSIDNILIKEPYTGGNLDDIFFEIVGGTIVHFVGEKPNLPTVPEPDKPSPPDDPYAPSEKPQVSTRPNKGSAKLTYTDELTLQVGARTKDSVNFTFSYGSEGIGGLKADLNCTAKGLGMDALSLKTQESANCAVDRLDCALNKVSKIRATFGAAQNRLEHKITDLAAASENLTEAEAGIRDTDMADEMMNYTKFNILRQAAQSMLAQANQTPQSALQLLG